LGRSNMKLTREINIPAILLIQIINQFIK